MLCGHEWDDYSFNVIDDLTPTLRRSTSTTSNGSRRLDRLNSTEIKTSSGSQDDQASVNTDTSTMVAQGPSVASGLSQSSSSTISNGLDHYEGLARSNSNGMVQGDKKEDRQSMLEKKYKVEKVKPASNHSSSSSSSSHQSPSSNPLVPVYPDGRYEDNSVPFPRTCGATFSSNDHLVIFCVPHSLKKMDQESNVTPRSLSDLVRVTAPNQWMRPSHPPASMFASLFGSPPPPSPSEGVSISDFFTEKHQHHHHHRKYSNHKSSHHGHSHTHGRSRDGVDGKKDREREAADRAKKRLHKVARVEIYNVTAISPVNLYLAKNYKVDLVDYKGCCQHNAKVAAKINRMDLVQMWNVVSQVLESHHRTSANDETQQPVALRPFGRPLVEKFFKHYEKYRDVQTMAMMACMFWDRETRPRDVVAMMRNNAMFSPTTSTTTPSSTITNTQGFTRPDSRLSFEGVNVETTALGTSNDSGWEMLMNKSKRSRSLSESFDDLNTIEKELGESEDREFMDGRDVDHEKLMHLNNTKILNPELRAQYEGIKRAYANILYKWGLLNQRAQVLKHTVSLHSSKKIEFSIPCSNCCDTVVSVQCNQCHYPSLNCAICHIGVRGPANVCQLCGHGGHSSHMMAWFHTNTQCPSGCGCNCMGMS